MTTFFPLSKCCRYSTSCAEPEGRFRLSGGSIDCRDRDIDVAGISLDISRLKAFEFWICALLPSLSWLITNGEMRGVSLLMGLISGRRGAWAFRLRLRRMNNTATITINTTRPPMMPPMIGAVFEVVWDDVGVGLDDDALGSPVRLALLGSPICVLKRQLFEPKHDGQFSQSENLVKIRSMHEPPLAIVSLLKRMAFWLERSATE